MKNNKNWLMLVMLMIATMSMYGCSSDENNPLAPATDTKAAALTADGDDIVDTAIAAGAFTTLVAAVQAAELEGALRGEGPFTVFAPTDDAFAALPDGFVAELLLPRNFEKLQELLLYHVIGDDYTVRELRRARFLQTLEGKYVWVRKLWNGSYRVNNAEIIGTDVMASNGIIQVIDKVLIPRGFQLVPEDQNPTLDIVDTAIAAGAFNTLVAAAGAAELVDALRGEGPLTVFAPTDAAFAKLPQDLVNALLLPENKSKLQALLLYHVVPGRVLSGDLDIYQRVDSLEGSPLRIIKWFGNVWVNWSRVTTADVVATNGVIHVIDRVLIPYGFSLDSRTASYDKDGLDAMLNAIQDELDPQEAPPGDADLQLMEAVR